MTLSEFSEGITTLISITVTVDTVRLILRFDEMATTSTLLRSGARLHVRRVVHVQVHGRLVHRARSPPPLTVDPKFIPGDPELETHLARMVSHPSDLEWQTTLRRDEVRLAGMNWFPSSPLSFRGRKGDAEARTPASASIRRDSAEDKSGTYGVSAQTS